MRANIITAVAILALLSISACATRKANDKTDDKPLPEAKAAFAKGADVSWLTQMEQEGLKFCTPAGQEMECMQLLRDECGINSIRLRVWVNPEEGWNGIDDVAAKARRAADLGMRLMIDFHFSDVWADPGHQIMPAQWQGKSLDQVKAALADHVTQVLSRLKEMDITPEWVQIGNETTPGMMLPMGSITENPAQYAALNNAGYDAAKAVFPDVKCIVHLDGGHDQARYDLMFDALQKYDGKYDMIGMSVYPYWAQQEGVVGSWEEIADQVLDNINHLKEKYRKPIMICEIGMPYDQADACKALIEKMMTADVEGIFYWEPQAPAGYNGGYTLGCFSNNAPTCALEALR